MRHFFNVAKIILRSLRYLSCWSGFIKYIVNQKNTMFLFIPDAAQNDNSIRDGTTDDTGPVSVGFTDEPGLQVC